MDKYLKILLFGLIVFVGCEDSEPEEALPNPVTLMDIYGQGVINKHIHTYSSDIIDVEQIRADDTNVDPSMEDEENYI